MPSGSSCQPVTSPPTLPQLALGEWERRKAARCGHAGCLVRRRSLPQTQASAPAVTDCRHGGGRRKDVLGGTMVVRPSRWTWLVCCLRKEEERERLTGFSQERGARARGDTRLASPATWSSVGLGATSQALPPIPLPQSTTQNHNAFASVPNTMAHTEAQIGTHGAPLSPAAKTKDTQILSVGQLHLPLTLAGTGSRSPGIPRRSRSPKHITPSETAVPQACPDSSLCMVFDLTARARRNSRHLSRAGVTNAKTRSKTHSSQPQTTSDNGCPPHALPKVHSASRQMPEALTNTSSRLRSG